MKKGQKKSLGGNREAANKCSKNITGKLYHDRKGVSR